MTDERKLETGRRGFLGAVGSLAGVSLLGSTNAQAAARTPGLVLKEPAVIGYPNQNGVTIERVTYPARNIGTKIVANLFKPAGFQASRKYAAIVVTWAFDWIRAELKARRVTVADLVRVTLRYGDVGTLRRIGALLDREGVEATELRRLERALKPSTSFIPWIPVRPKRGTLDRRWGVVWNDRA